MPKIYKYQDLQLKVIEVENSYKQETEESTEEKPVFETRYDLLVDLNRDDGERIRIFGTTISGNAFVAGRLPDNINEKFEEQHNA